MFYKPFYITFIIITTLLFSFQKSKAGVCLIAKQSGYNVPETLSNSPIHATRAINDMLTNSNDDDDDETSSKTKHRLPKITVSLNHKFNTSKQAIQALFKFNDGGFTYLKGKYYSPNSLFFKTSISIALCCLKI